MNRSGTTTGIFDVNLYLPTDITKNIFEPDIRQTKMVEFLLIDQC
jgi:hypothetical protein